MTPMRFIRLGAIQVALTSKTVDMPRMMPTCHKLMLDASKYVNIWPEKDSTVKYSSDREKEGMNAGWPK